MANIIYDTKGRAHEYNANSDLAKLQSLGWTLPSSSGNANTVTAPKTTTTPTTTPVTTPTPTPAPTTAPKTTTTPTANQSAPSTPTWQQLLNQYQHDQQAAAQEILRAKQVYESEKASYGAGFDSTDRAKQISTWADQVRNASGLTGNEYNSSATVNQSNTAYNNTYNPAPVVKSAVATEAPKEEDYKQQLIDALMSQINNQNSGNEALAAQLQNLAFANSQLNINPSLTYDQALKQAQNRLNPLYDEQMDKVLNAVDKNTLQRGFFGQLPAAAMKRSTAEQTERGKQNAIAELAQTLVGQSQADADRRAQLGLQQQSNQLNAIVAALSQANSSKQNGIGNILSMLGYMDGKDNTEWEKNFKEQQYQDSRSAYNDQRSDIEWEKEFKEKTYNDQIGYQNWQKAITQANLTGIFEGQPTMAYTSMMHGIGMDKKQAELAEKQSNATISQGWARINQAAQEFNFNKDQASKIKVPDQNELMRAIKSQAISNTLDYFKTSNVPGGFSQQEFDNVYMGFVDKLTDNFSKINKEDEINSFFNNLPSFTNSLKMLK